MVSISKGCMNYYYLEIWTLYDGQIFIYKSAVMGKNKLLIEDDALYNTELFEGEKIDKIIVKKITLPEYEVLSKYL